MVDSLEGEEAVEVVGAVVGAASVELVAHGRVART